MPLPKTGAAWLDGPALRNARRAKGLSQSEVARSLNKHQTAISRWESGRYQVDYRQIQHLAKVLDVDREMLVARLTNVDAAMAQLDFAIDAFRELLATAARPATYTEPTVI